MYTDDPQFWLKRKLCDLKILINCILNFLPDQKFGGRRPDLILDTELLPCQSDVVRFDGTNHVGSFAVSTKQFPEKIGEKPVQNAPEPVIRSMRVMNYPDIRDDSGFQGYAFKSRKFSFSEWGCVVPLYGDLMSPYLARVFVVRIRSVNIDSLPLNGKSGRCRALTN